jgi:hypothetical protein
MKKGVRAIRWDKNREGTLKLTAEIFDLKWLSILLGSDVVTGATGVAVREVLTVASSKVAVKDAPKAGSIAVFTLEADLMTHKKEQTAGTPVTTPDTYSIASKDITLNATSCPDGTKVAVYYLMDSTATAKKFEVKIDKYPVNYEIYLKTYIRDTDGVDRFLQVQVPNCKPKSTASISMTADNPTTLNMEFDLFADASNNMAIFSIIE